mgnify:FL=1
MKNVLMKNSDVPIDVGKILCIGQNYIEHAKEMNFEVPQSPVIFLKPSTAILPNEGTVVLPQISKNVQHEVELVVLIGKTGKNIPLKLARNYVAGCGVGLDMTMRDLQLEAKQKGLPWALAKGFDTSAPVSEFVPIEEIPDIKELILELTVNGELRQKGFVKDMIFSVEELIAYISRFITIEEGDLLFTGTPPGVASVKPNDTAQARLLFNGNLLTSLNVTFE